MGEDQKKQLEQQLWNIANTLRGKMDADEFRDYILGFIFYKYLSEKMEAYGDTLLAEDGIEYIAIDEQSSEGQELLAPYVRIVVASVDFDNWRAPSPPYPAQLLSGNRLPARTG